MHSNLPFVLALKTQSAKRIQRAIKFKEQNFCKPTCLQFQPIQFWSKYFLSIFPNHTRIRIYYQLHFHTNKRVQTHLALLCNPAHGGRRFVPFLTYRECELMPLQMRADDILLNKNEREKYKQTNIHTSIQKINNTIPSVHKSGATNENENSLRGNRWIRCNAWLRAECRGKLTSCCVLCVRRGRKRLFRHTHGSNEYPSALCTEEASEWEEPKYRGRSAIFATVCVSYLLNSMHNLPNLSPENDCIRCGISSRSSPSPLRAVPPLYTDSSLHTNSLLAHMFRGKLGMCWHGGCVSFVCSQPAAEPFENDIFLLGYDSRFDSRQPRRANGNDNFTAVIFWVVSSFRLENGTG